MNDNQLNCIKFPSNIFDEKFRQMPVFARVHKGGDFNQVIDNILYCHKLLSTAFLDDT